MRRAALFLVVAVGALAQTLDQYGGDTRYHCAASATGMFYADRLDNRDWLCTPDGHVFFSKAIYAASTENATDFQGVNPYTLTGLKYATGITTNAHYNWANQTAIRAKSWGFNTWDMYAYAVLSPTATWGGWPTSDHAIATKLPFIKAYNFTMHMSNNYLSRAPGPVKDLGWGVLRTVWPFWMLQQYDYFDANFRTYIDAEVAGTAPAANGQWILGTLSDETDQLGWAGFGDDFPTPGYVTFHGGWIALVTSPVQTVNTNATIYQGTKLAYADTAVYTKHALADALEAKYTTTDALNTAWGSSYTSFGSTGTVVTGESLGTGDGSTKTFSLTLSQASPSKFSIQILVAGVPLGGDKPDTSTIVGPGVTSGTINYGTKALSVTLAAAPALDAAVTVNYVSCGFGCGTGLLDEDGTRAWVPVATAGNLLTGGTTALRADLDDFLKSYADQYFSNCRYAIAAAIPGVMYWGISSIGTWGAPARKAVLQSANQYADLVRVSIDAERADADDALAFIAQWIPDRPLMGNAYFKTGGTDTYFATDPRGAGAGCGVGDVNTQEERGTLYRNLTQLLLTPIGGTVRFAGITWWELIDNRGECAGFGLMTPRDNPYDGVSAVIAAGTDQWGYATGGEIADYGDLITGVTAANALWVPGAPPDAPDPPATPDKQISGVRLEGVRMQ